MNSFAFKKIKLSNGELSISNSEISIQFNELKYLWDFIKFFGAVGLLFTFYNKVNNFNSIEGFYENAKVILFGLASFGTIYFFIEILLKRIWKNTLELANIERIEIYDEKKHKNEIDDEDKIEIELFSNNKRSKRIKVFKKENNLETLIHELKRRNSRIKIEYLN